MYQEPGQTSEMELFADMVNDRKFLAIFAKIPVLDVSRRAT